MLRLLAVPALFLTLALAACGGDDDTDVTPSPTAEPTASPSPSPSPSPAPTVEQLSYIGPTGDIRLVDADGTGDRVLAPSPCDPDKRTQEFSMAWSPDGSALGFVCAPETSSIMTLVVIDQAGVEVARVPDVTRFRWSPDGTRLAYQTLLEPFDVGLLELASGETETLHGNAVLMEWVGPGVLLLGLEPVLGDLAIEFKAHLIDLASGASTEYPVFDNARMLWVSPDGAKALILTEQRDPNGSGPGMAVYDFTSTQETVIAGGYIGYPSEFIPHEQLAFSHNGATIYWANAADAPSTVWTARLDAPEAEKLGEAQSIFVAVSPSGLVAGLLPEEGSPGRIVVQDLAAGSHADVGLGGAPFAWRTTAP